MGPKYPTPASGVRASTSRAELDSRESRAVEERERSRADEEMTPVNMPVPRLVERINERTKATTSTTDSIHRRVETLEQGLTGARLEIAGVKSDVGGVKIELAGLDGKVDVLVEEAQHTRREREEREKRAETRADEELRFRRDRAFKVIAIVVPTLTALGALVAGIIAATREPEIVRVPAAPAPIHSTPPAP